MLLQESISIIGKLQRNGFGSAIIADLISQAEITGLTLTLQVLKPNPAKRLYERLGFSVVGENTTHFQMAHMSYQ